jgi:NAD(P)H-flavin reductase
MGDLSMVVVSCVFYQSKIFVLTSTGWAALVPLIILCLHSVPWLRRRAYEIFILVHGPIAMVFLGMMFWHCHNYLTSWDYLFATVAIWVLAIFTRCFKLNWLRINRMSWLIGDEARVSIQPDNAVKITVATQVNWRPGQYIYLRMPGISFFENHPFTITSIASDEYLTDEMEIYRDLILMFRPYGGFTKKVLEAAIEKGPQKVYRAFLDGPYGGMQRRMDSFDTCVLVAGGSGITALISHLLDLVKRMRDGKAITQQVQVVWAVRRPEAVEWFKRELEICREYAPPESISCQIFITAAKRESRAPPPQPKPRPISGLWHDKVNDFAQGIASKRTSAYIVEEAAGDVDREKELRAENEDRIHSLPPPARLNVQTQGLGLGLGGINSLQSNRTPSIQSSRRPSLEIQTQTSRRPSLEIQTQPREPSLDLPKPAAAHTRQRPSLSLNTAPTALTIPNQNYPDPGFEFGFPSTPTVFQKNLMKFAFFAPKKKMGGWSTEYGRPELSYMMKEFAKDFGKRTCVFVCGPPAMRVDVSDAVARLQQDVLSGESDTQEIFLHTENYAI